MLRPSPCSAVTDLSLSGAVPTRDRQAIRACRRRTWQMAERARSGTRRGRRNHPGSLSSPYRQEAKGSASRRCTWAHKGARVASTAKGCRGAGARCRQRRELLVDALIPSSTRCRAQAQGARSHKVTAKDSNGVADCDKQGERDNCGQKARPHQIFLRIGGEIGRAHV